MDRLGVTVLEKISDGFIQGVVYLALDPLNSDQLFINGLGTILNKHPLRFVPTVVHSLTIDGADAFRLRGTCVHFCIDGSLTWISAKNLRSP